MYQEEKKDNTPSGFQLAVTHDPKGELDKHKTW